MHCTALYCTALHCTALHCTALHCTALHCTTLHLHYTIARSCVEPQATQYSERFVAMWTLKLLPVRPAAPLLVDRVRGTLHCTTLRCTALNCTALHGTALHCTALHCTGRNRTEFDRSDSSLCRCRLKCAVVSVLCVCVAGRRHAVASTVHRGCQKCAQGSFDPL